MGYELIIKYREKNDEGEYAEEIQEKKIKIGSPYDDVSLDICAGKIIAQLANRKKLVEDVEIYEYTKKKLTYKEADDGILIKNKKFRFEDGPIIQGEEIENSPEQQLSALLAANPHLRQAMGQPQQPNIMPHNVVPPQLPIPSQLPQAPPVATAPHQSAGNRFKIREEVFDPPHRKIAQIEAAHFTVGEAYPIYEEFSRGVAPLTRTFYLIGDKNGKAVKKAAEFFVPKQGKLQYADLMQNQPGLSEEIPLDYGGNDEFTGAMPDIHTLG